MEMYATIFYVISDDVMHMLKVKDDPLKNV